MWPRPGTWRSACFPMPLATAPSKTSVVSTRSKYRDLDGGGYGGASVSLVHPGLAGSVGRGGWLLECVVGAWSPRVLSVTQTGILPHRRVISPLAGARTGRKLTGESS